MQNQQTGEIEVGQSLELFEQVKWQECPKSILGRLDVVVLKKNKTGIKSTKSGSGLNISRTYGIVESAVVHAVVGNNVSAVL